MQYRMLNSESYFICIPVKMWHHMNYMEILHWSTLIRVPQEGAIKDLRFLTLGQWQIQNTIFVHTLVFCLLYLAARQKINEEFKNNRDEKSEEKINEVFSCFLLFEVFSHFA